MTDLYGRHFLAFAMKQRGAAIAVRGVVIGLASLALTGCDSAGTVLDSSARIAAVEQCTQLSEGAGIAAGAVNSVCNCAADKWLAKPVAERVQLDSATIQSIINDCAGTDRKPETPASSETY